MSQQKTQDKEVVIPQTDEVSVSVAAGYVFIAQESSNDGSEETVCFHPMFAEAVCEAIMRAAKIARAG